MIGLTRHTWCSYVEIITGVSTFNTICNREDYQDSGDSSGVWHSVLCANFNSNFLISNKINWNCKERDHVYNSGVNGYMLLTSTLFWNSDTLNHIVTISWSLLISLTYNNIDLYLRFVYCALSLHLISMISVSYCDIDILLHFRFECCSMFSSQLWKVTDENLLFETILFYALKGSKLFILI